MLSPNDRALLEKFQQENAPDAAYLHRVQILLLSDDGLTAEDIATRTGVAVNQVRHWQRAFNRQGMALFPEKLFAAPPLFALDDNVVEAGRQIMAAQFIIIQTNRDKVVQQGDPLAIYEMRKALRRTFTAFRLFAPYFEANLLEKHRRHWKPVMKLLGQVRDEDVFDQKLTFFIQNGVFAEMEQQALNDLQDYSLEQKAAATTTLQNYLRQPKVLRFLQRYTQFVQTPEQGVAADNKAAAYPIRYLIPGMIYQKLAVVRTFESQIDGDASPESLHQLRLRFKGLRYTLQFFEPVLRHEAAVAIDLTRQIQDALGDLNDAHVALTRLAQSEGYEVAAALYRRAKEQEQSQLTDQFRLLWQDFIRPGWRQTIAAAAAQL